MPADKFAGFAQTPSDPAQLVFDVTPSDTTDLSEVTTALNVATPGTVRVTTLAGSVTDVSVTPGYAFPLRVTRVWATGTTATGIRGLV